MGYLKCAFCEKKFYKRPCEYKRYNFCSQKCWREFQKKYPEVYCKHGMEGTKTYNCWVMMKQRCKNPKCQFYPDYGGRGISYCEEWEKFENFYKDMGDKPKGYSLDRIDVNGNYYKENCRWATNSQQANNKRTSRKITYGKKTMTISEWASSLKINPQTLRSRFDRGGWSVEEALTIPVGVDYCPICKQNHKARFCPKIENRRNSKK